MRGLLVSVADAFPHVRIWLILGPVERDPDGWAALIDRGNVSLEGPVVGERLRLSSPMPRLCSCHTASMITPEVRTR